MKHNLKQTIGISATLTVLLAISVGCGEKKEQEVADETTSRVVKPANASQGMVQPETALNPKANRPK